ncbi:hypothetical protein Tco_0985477 [Tanacetum coccineum]
MGVGGAVLDDGVIGVGVVFVMVMVDGGGFVVVVLGGKLNERGGKGKGGVGRELGKMMTFVGKGEGEAGGSWKNGVRGGVKGGWGGGKEGMLSEVGRREVGEGRRSGMWKGGVGGEALRRVEGMGAWGRVGGSIGIEGDWDMGGIRIGGRVNTVFKTDFCLGQLPWGRGAQGGSADMDGVGGTVAYLEGHGACEQFCGHVIGHNKSRCRSRYGK